MSYSHAVRRARPALRAESADYDELDELASDFEAALGPRVRVGGPDASRRLEDPRAVSASQLELAPGEVVFETARVMLADAPGASRGIEGVAVLTNERLVIVPHSAPRPTSAGPVMQALERFWSHMSPVFADAFPLATLFMRGRLHHAATIAGRARPGVEVALETIGAVFEARVPGWIGLELHLPAPDPRPPFTLYLQVGAAPGDHREWARLVEAQRKVATMRPEVERPYALYYLLRPPPSASVRVTSRSGVETGTLKLGDDGPSLGRSGRPLVSYESITALAFAPPTQWRRAHLRIEAGAHAWDLAPRSEREAAWLHDLSRLLGELSGRAVLEIEGPLRRVRVGGALLMAATASSFALIEMLHAAGLPMP